MRQDKKKGPSKNDLARKVKDSTQVGAVLVGPEKEDRLTRVTDEQIIDLAVSHSNYREGADYEVLSHARIVEFARVLLALRQQSPSQEGWRDMSSAPKDGTRILAVLHREACEDMDGIRRKAFAEIREIFYQPYTQFGMDLPWHAGDPLDSHEGFAPDHMGEDVPVAWLPREALPATPEPKPATEGGV